LIFKLVLELCDFGSLADIMRLRNKQPFANNDVVYIAFSVLSALQCLHQFLILHRDVKPDNVLVTSDGAARLADFGIATALALPTDRRHSVIGTSHYLAPEIIMSAGYDVKVDIWSLGLSLIELLDGKHPYAGQDAFRVMYLISAAPPPIATNALAPLAQVIELCLNKRPDVRPSAAELLAHAVFSDAHQLRGLDTRLFAPLATNADSAGAANNGDALQMPTAWAAPSFPVTPVTPKASSAFASTAPIDVVQKKPTKTVSTRSPKPRETKTPSTESKSERIDSSDSSTTSSLMWPAPSPSMPLSPSPVARDVKSTAVEPPKGSRERRDRPRAAAGSSSSSSGSKKSSTLRDKTSRARPLADAQRVSSVSVREASPPPPPPEPVDMPPALPDYSDDDDEADRLPPIKSAMLPTALRSAATAVPAPPPGVPPRTRNQAVPSVAVTTPQPHRGPPPPRPPPTVGSPQSPPQMATALSSPTGPSDLLRPQSRRRFGTLASEALAPLHELDAAPIRFDPRQPMLSLSASRDMSRDVSRDVSPISSPLKVSAAALDTEPLNEEDARIQLLMALARRGLPMPAPSEIYFALRQARGDPELASDIVERMQGRVDAAVPASGAGDPHVQLLSQLRSSGLASLSSRRVNPTAAAQHCPQCARSLATVAPLIEGSGRLFCSAICAHAFEAGPPPMPPARSSAPTAPTPAPAVETSSMSVSARHNGAMSPSFVSAPSSPGRVRPVPPPALHRGESLLMPSTKPVLSKRLSASALDDLSELGSSGRLDDNDDDNFGDLPAPRYATIGFDMATMMRGGSESARAPLSSDIAVPPRRKPPQPPKLN
jgi:serine/threonine protein kinase